MASGALQWHRAEIRQLEAEIAQLTQQLWEDTEGAPQQGDWLLQPTPPGPLPEQAEELKRLEAELAYLAGLSGVEFTALSRKALERGAAGSLGLYRVSGRCCSLPFQLEFQIRAPAGSPPEVVALSIVMESAASHGGLGAFLSRVEERRGLLLFLRTLASLASWAERRRAAFARLRACYPEAVRLPEGAAAELLVLRDAGGSGCELLIAWRFRVSPEGAVIPLLDLLPRLPEQAQALDTRRRVLERAPAAFRALLGVCGIEGALESLIQAFAL